MPSLLMFEPEMGLTVDEDVEAVRDLIGRPTEDGFVELHVSGEKALVRINAIKCVREEKSATGGGFGFKTGSAAEG